ncbi:unnamed protein product, partial [Polarella glacialis]
MALAGAPRQVWPELPYAGTLEKKSELLGIWQPRQVEVAMGSLRYYKAGYVESRADFGAGDVEDVGEELPSTLLLYAWLENGEKRIYRFRASGTAEMQVWAQLIREAFNLMSPPTASAGSAGPVARAASRTSSWSGASSWSGNLLGKVTQGAGIAMGQVSQSAGAAIEKSTWLSEKLNLAKSTSSQWMDQMGQQMEEALSSCDEGKTEMLLDKVLYTGMTSDMMPSAVRRAARRIASRNLREAMESGDPTRLKGALVAARRLHAADVPEFAPAVQKFRAVQRLPEGWDVGRMVEERRRGAGKLLTRPDVSGDTSLLALVQLMFDRTNRRVTTRDRRGEQIPLRLEVVRVEEVQNIGKWVDYLVRRDGIREATKLLCSPSGGSLPADFRYVNAETEAPLAEAQALVAMGSWPAKLSRAAVDPLVPQEVVSPITGQPMWVKLPPSTSISPAGEAVLENAILHALPGPELDPNLNEAWLFHGTRPIAAERITQNDFQIDLAGSSTGTLYGRGIYLAENCSKADEYSHPDHKSGLFTMLLCRVALGRLLYSAEVQPDPRFCEESCLQGRFDSVLGDRKACRGTFREFAVFDEDAVLPQDYALHIDAKDVYMVILMDTLNFGIVFPLLPSIAETFGADATQVGSLATAYSVAQVLFTPILGKASDRFGRRPVLLIAVFGTMLSAAVTGLAWNFYILLLARAVNGASGGTAGIANAYIADVTTPEEKAVYISYLSAANSIGIILGPAL